MSPSFFQIAIVVVIIAVLFGGKRLRNLGGDLGASLKGFKNAMKEDKDGQAPNIEHKEADDSVVKTVESSETADKIDK